MQKDPLSYEYVTYFWVVGLSMWAGISSYVRKIRAGQVHPSIPEFIGEICISGFAGIITFFLCESAKIPPVMSAAMIGVSAHMSSRSIFLLENVFDSLIKKWIKQHDRTD